ncbi:M56 family metallopeptidase [Streptomyces sp. MB09-02B]|uniref:M56 family metallopeptidase n=1 Tax=Streptomyces sp. MB09-02B TaxID=3028667 RepID=UPI0029B6AECB|nr:M56 family metallopeptidase [Streptomyces sp. MB09-02B]MDX3640395.1 M56 family metallopeptidase [Streptomyces sp. MB09-02B]
MNAAPLLLAYTATVGFVAPPLVLRAAWPHRAPALALLVWHTLTLSFALGAALTVYHLLMPAVHTHEGLLGLLHSCGLDLGLGPGASGPDRDIAGRLAVGVPAALGTALTGSFAFHVVRARRARARHREAVDLVGRRCVRLGATVLPYDVPAAYCLPGHRPRIVISDAAVRELSPEQLAAVLAHERAHVAGRHHLVIAAAAAFHSLFPRLPLARHARAQTTLLLEMVADDRALRTHSDSALASAMYEMAAARTPKDAFAAGGPAVLLRIRRVLGPRPPAHRALRGSVAAVIATVPLLPLLVACPLGAA